MKFIEKLVMLISVAENEFLSWELRTLIIFIIASLLCVMFAINGENIMINKGTLFSGNY